MTEIHTCPPLFDILQSAASRFAKIILLSGTQDTGDSEPSRQPTGILPVKTEKIPAKFASPGDIATRHVTMNVSDLVRHGLLDRRTHLVQGDKILTTVNGIYTEWRVNRKNARTLAAKLPPGLELPRIDAEGYHKVLYDVEVDGIDPVEG